MTEDTSTHFAKLNNFNYASWSIMMETELICKITIADADKKSPEELKAELEAQKSKRKANKMAQARSEMILCIKPRSKVKDSPKKVKISNCSATMSRHSWANSGSSWCNTVMSLTKLWVKLQNLAC
ncbi:hypothetical protein BDP27DRAFT_1360347 [Rhodocollybia butyracea]|uniref:Uncharacterized protein n=1 Tax=Rhodocollybia butyracea TaxID=206335 RepID=A0A9P5UBT7_9AGAR|nr:hypothetical protein BDP27DRAFT_1360347 [Rhodocollybia butyracea]